MCRLCVLVNFGQGFHLKCYFPYHIFAYLFQMQAAMDEASSRDLKACLLETSTMLWSALKRIDDLLEEQQQQQHKVDLDETFYEPAERQAAAGKMFELDQEELSQGDDPSDGCIRGANEHNANGAEEELSQMDVSSDWSEGSEGEHNASSTPEKHVCRLPRCWEHQPFRGTDREIAGLPKEEKRLRSKEPAYTPKGFWSLDM
ncbi:uncharacterized protein LOC113213669 [Frankliniella occidentalis]|uniref:Uncharacterized protein LOC113213669 n=1 Tax=Frankliniella occidentalis TaxID=133901 RepID=A0A9C6TVJ6_FRAOC|nr:uncharacterized protein LOC113213669 [Frankliniella occidentalis]